MIHWSYVTDKLFLFSSKLLCKYTFVFVSAGAGYASIVPDAIDAESHPRTKKLAENISKHVKKYLGAMEQVNDLSTV